MATAVNGQTGATVSADEAVLRRLAPPWRLQATTPPKKPAPKRRRSKAAEPATDDD